MKHGWQCGLEESKGLSRLGSRCSVAGLMKLFSGNPSRRVPRRADSLEMRPRGCNARNIGHVSSPVPCRPCLECVDEDVETARRGIRWIKTLREEGRFPCRYTP